MFDTGPIEVKTSDDQPQVVQRLNWTGLTENNQIEKTIIAPCGGSER